MLPPHIHHLSIVFAIVTGTAAGVLALLAWRILRRGPFGRGIFVLSLAMSLFIVYHAALIEWPSEPLETELARTATYSLMLVVIVLLIQSHRRMSRTVR